MCVTCLLHSFPFNIEPWHRRRRPRASPIASSGTAGARAPPSSIRCGPRIGPRTALRRYVAWWKGETCGITIWMRKIFMVIWGWLKMIEDSNKDWESNDLNITNLDCIQQSGRNWRLKVALERLCGWGLSFVYDMSTTTDTSLQIWHIHSVGEDASNHCITGMANQRCKTNKMLTLQPFSASWQWWWTQNSYQTMCQKNMISIKSGKIKTCLDNSRYV